MRDFADGSAQVPEQTSPVVVTFYTAGNGYDDEVERLRESCRAHGVDLDATAVADQGSWLRNCAMKPEFLASRMRHHTPRPVLWVDADAAIRRPIADVGHWDCDIALRKRRGREVLSGTVFLRDTTASRALVETWARLCHDRPDQADQCCLADALQVERGLKVRWLDPEWCFIFDLDREEHPDVTPVIEHFQASRRLKRRRAARGPSGLR